jgi:hypothetical protein
MVGDRFRDEQSQFPRVGLSRRRFVDREFCANEANPGGAGSAADGRLKA